MFGVISCKYWIPRLSGTLHAEMRTARHPPAEEGGAVTETLRVWWDAQKTRANYGEFAGAIVRVGIGLALLSAYYAWVDWGEQVWGLYLCWGFLAYSLVLFAWIYRSKAASDVARYLPLVVDIVTATTLLGLTGERSAIVWFVYTWTPVAYGLRFGLRYLYVSWMVSVVGCGLVYALSAAVDGFWYEHPLLWLGAFIWVAAPTVYVAILLKQKLAAVQSAEEARVQTERAQADAERERVERARAEAERARAEAEAASEAKSEFLATMSHEMRTPLNGVVGAAELLAAKDLPQRERQLVDWLLASSRQLRSLIDNLLDLRKIEAGKMAIERVPFDLRVLMSRLAALFELEAKRAKLRFTQRVAADVPHILIGDDARIRQVLINLIANALKFTREGGISVTAGVAQSGADVTLRFEVRDSGIGIASEDAARIFDKFAQANAGIHRQYGGSGLGTTICKHLVELMGGSIGFDSQPGRGTAFWFTIPLGYRPTELLRDAEAGLAGQEFPCASGLRVLVAEDNAINQQIIAMMLQAGGHHVTLVSDGDAVIEQFRNLRFHALVLDMHMPGRTGLEVARAVRVLETHGGLQRTPIVMLTAAASANLQQSSIDAGVDLFLSKPVDPRALLRGVSQVVSSASAPAAPAARRNCVDRDLVRDIAQLAADPRFLAGFTGRFTQEARRLIDEIEAALSRGDFRRSRELAHSLKGAAVMTGAVRLGDSAARLESLSGTDLGEIGSGVLQDLRATLDATSEELSRVV